MRSSFQIFISSRVEKTRGPGVCSCSRQAFLPRTRSDRVPQRIPFGFLPVSADAGSLDSARSSASGRSCCARDDREKEETEINAMGAVSLRCARTSGVNFGAPTFCEGLERWGTPRLWWGRRSTEILCWKSLALPRTPLPQDDSVSRANAAIRQLIRRLGRGLLRSSFQIFILSRAEKPRCPGVCSCSRQAFLPRTRSDRVPAENSLRLLAGIGRRGVPRLRKIVRERTIFLRSG